MNSEWLREREVAALAGAHPDTVRRWRQLGTGPRWHRFGPRTIRYRRADVEEWIASTVGRAA